MFAGFASHSDHLVGMGATLWANRNTHDSVGWEDSGCALVECDSAGYACQGSSREKVVFDPRLCV